MCAKQNTVPSRKGRGLKGSVILAGPVMCGRTTPLEPPMKTSDKVQSGEGMSLPLPLNISPNFAENTITLGEKEKLRKAFPLIG